MLSFGFLMKLTSSNFPDHLFFLIEYNIYFNQKGFLSGVHSVYVTLLQLLIDKAVSILLDSYKPGMSCNNSKTYLRVFLKEINL